MPDKPLSYRRMTSEEFTRALETHHLSQGDFCRLAGSSRKKVMQWAEGTEDIPPWVPVAFAMMSVPGALAEAWAEVDRRAIRD